jgi:hypothetical protein
MRPSTHLQPYPLVSPLSVPLHSPYLRIGIAAACSSTTMPLRRSPSCPTSHHPLSPPHFSTAARHPFSPPDHPPAAAFSTAPGPFCTGAAYHSAALSSVSTSLRSSKAISRCCAKSIWVGRGQTPRGVRQYTKCKCRKRVQTWTWTSARLNASTAVIANCKPSYTSCGVPSEQYRATGGQLDLKHAHETAKRPEFTLLLPRRPKTRDRGSTRSVFPKDTSPLRGRHPLTSNR